MPSTVNGFSLAYAAAGGIILYSGIKGSSISDTVRSALAGSTAPPVTESLPGAAEAASAAAAGAAPAAGTAAAVTAPATASQASWAQSLLTAIGAPATAANLASVEHWIAAEGDFSLPGHNNPLNTTLVTSGSTGSINSVGVQNYGSATQGVEATVQTLETGGYGDILMLLRSGQGLASGAAAGLSKWSGGAYASV